MPKTRLYRYSTDGLVFREVRWGRTRLATLGMVLGMVLLAIAAEVNQRYDDPIGLGIVQNAALLRENRVLREQLKFIGSRIEKVQKNLDNLGDQGNEFRLRADLTPLDPDVEQAGTGGTDERVEFGTSRSVGDLLNNIRGMVSRVEQEAQLQATSYAEVSRKLDEDKVRFTHLPAVKPMDGFYSYDFGMRLHPILGIYRPHQGIDIVASQGTPVHATADGVVEYAGRESGLGLMVTINHGYSIKTTYGHLSKILVREGQKVKRGDLIARSGNTGLSTGPHLHYEVRVNGVAHNPRDYFFNDDVD